MTAPDIRDARTSPPRQAIAEEDLAALRASKPSNTAGHSEPVEELEVLTEDQLRRMVIDEVQGKSRMGRTPREREVQERLAQEIARIKEQPGAFVDISSEIPGTT